LGERKTPIALCALLCALIKAMNKYEIVTRLESCTIWWLVRVLDAWACFMMLSCDDYVPAK
jgi:hypothetical protein